MDAWTTSDCNVIFIGDSHERYRLVNQCLKQLGLRVVWVRDLAAAQALVSTADTGLVICDADEARTTADRILSKLAACSPLTRGLVLTSATNPAGSDESGCQRLVRAVARQCFPSHTGLVAA